MYKMIEQNLQQAVSSALLKLYNLTVDPSSVVLQATKKEFEGDYTVVVFPFVKQARRSPEQLANELGAAVKEAGKLHIEGKEYVMQDGDIVVFRFNV